MERGLMILLVAVLMVYLSPGVKGTSHLSFSNDTVNVTRLGCGNTKLCVSTPDDCDPAGNKSCLFAAVVANNTMAPNGTELAFELRGDSAGYVALGLTVNASEGTTMLFICAQNSSDNESFFFRTMDRNNSNNELTPTETRVKGITGMVNGSVIKCEFIVPKVNASNTRSSHDTTFSILLGTGNVTGNAIGPFNTSLNSGPLNLADPASNVPTSAPPTSAPNSSGAVQPHAVLLLLSVLTLSVLLRA
ncbi:putative ferric-chelate reductase 1 [Plectropomus leopardus]|uniref:putative ferric-chelate reductase 1 n=1 Tax=Plectropomus leopardus TaxID=160734 RepID=UPI001C4B110C|nr:putative ferric-chelate reductase 1 [Plectropomus leopardus]